MSEAEVMVISDHVIDYGLFIERVEESFGIFVTEHEYTRHINLFVERIDVLRDAHGIYTMDELKGYVLKNLADYNNDILSVEISSEVINIKDVKNTFGKNVFSNDDTEGWLVFIDPCKIANWSHQCEYWFVTNERKYSKAEEKWPPSEDVDLLKLI